MARFRIFLGNVSAAGAGTSLTPTTGTLTWVGNTPSISQARTLTPTTGAAAFSGNTPSITQARSLTPTTGILEWSGNTPSITSGRTLTPATGTLSLVGNTPTISQARTLTPTTGEIIWVGNVPSITRSNALTPTTGEVTWAGNTPSISQPRSLTPSAGLLAWTGNVPSITRGLPAFRELLRTAQVAANAPGAGQDYSFDGAAVSPLAFSFASRGLVTGDTVSYYADNGAGSWERGLGTWDADALTLTRTTIRESSASGAAVDWSAGAAPTVWCDGRQPEDDMEMPATGILYIGSPAANGSWRVTRVGDDLEFQRRESGSWVKKVEIQA